MNTNLGRKSIALALSLALAVVVSGAYVAQARTMPSITSQAALTFSDVALGFGAAFGDIPSRIAERVDSARINVRAKSKNEIAYAEPDLSSMRVVIEKMLVSYPESTFAVVPTVPTSDSTQTLNRTKLDFGLAAAAASGFSAGEQVALNIYGAVSDFFGSANRAVTNFFAPPPPVAPPVVDATEPSAQSVIVAASSSPPRPPVGGSGITNITRTSNSYPTYTTVIQGVSPEYMEKSLASLRTELLSSISNSIRPVAAQTVTNAQTIQMVSRIESLSDLIVRNGDFRNSIFDNGVRVSATGGNFTTLTGGTTNLGATTVTGDLSLTGSTTLQNFTFANATGTNATTTSFFATTASSTNLFTSNFSIASLSGFLKATAGSVATALINLASDVTGVLPVANGGTGWAAIASGALTYGNGSSALATTTAGTSGYVLALNGSTPTWVATTTFSSGLTYSAGNVTNTGVLSLGVTGTALTGALTIATSSTAFNGLTASTTVTGSGTTLTFANTLAGILGVGGGGTGLSSVTDGQLLFGSGSTNALTALATSTGGVLTNSYTTGRPSWTATSTLFGTGTGGQVLGWSNATGGLAFVATSSSASAITALGSGFASTTGATITFSTTTLAFNGLTFGQTIVPSASALMFTPTVTGTLSVGGGGTGQTSFGQGWLHSDGTTLTSSTSPTINYIIATSTTASNIFASTTTAPYFALSGLGTIGAPVLTFTGDLNTGIWSSGADTLNLSTAGSERLRIDSSGNVGIGTTSPFRSLSITGAVSTAQQAIAYDTGNYTDILTSSVGDMFVYPSGNDALFNNSNLWVCTGGSGNTNGCPSGTPSGFGNLIVETKFGVASSTPWAAISIGANGAIVTTEKSLTDGVTIAIDWTQGNQQLVTLGGNRTITFSGYIPGQTLRFVVCQDATGSRTLTWPAAVLWGGGTAPTLTTTANKCDVTTFLTTSATGTVQVLGSSVLNF